VSQSIVLQGLRCYCIYYLTVKWRGREGRGEKRKRRTFEFSWSKWGNRRKNRPTDRRIIQDNRNRRDRRRAFPRNNINIQTISFRFLI